MGLVWVLAGCAWCGGTGRDIFRLRNLGKILYPIKRIKRVCMHNRVKGDRNLNPIPYSFILFNPELEL